MGINLGWLTKSPFFMASFVLVQNAAGHYDANDEWVNGSEIRTTLSGSVSAASPKNSRSNTEAGERNIENIKIACDRTVIVSALHIALPAKNDIVQYGGFDYLVTGVQDWKEHNLIDIYATIKSFEGN